MPRTMNSAYARIGSGPRCQTGGGGAGDRGEVSRVPTLPRRAADGGAHRPAPVRRLWAAPAGSRRPRRRARRPARSAVSAASAARPAASSGASSRQLTRRCRRSPRRRNAATSAACAPLPHARGRPRPAAPVPVARTRATSAGAACEVLLAGAGDAHHRGGVDEAAAVRHGHRDPLVGRRRRRPGRPGPARARRRRPATPAASSGIRSGVIRPAPPAAARSRANAAPPATAVALDRVPVGHHEHRRAGVGDRLDRAQHVAVRTPAASARSVARWITGPSITGSEYGSPTSTTSTPASTMARIASIAAGHGGEPGRQVADQRGPALGARLLERRPRRSSPLRLVQHAEPPRRRCPCPCRRGRTG